MAGKHRATVGRPSWTTVKAHRDAEAWRRSQLQLINKVSKR